MAAFDESQAHLVHPDGTEIQVLKTVEDANSDPVQIWDEAATHAAYQTYASSLL
jgi:hypothetical protein